MLQQQPQQQLEPAAGQNTYTAASYYYKCPLTGARLEALTANLPELRKQAIAAAEEFDCAVRIMRRSTSTAFADAVVETISPDYGAIEAALAEHNGNTHDVPSYDEYSKEQYVNG